MTDNYHEIAQRLEAIIDTAIDGIIIIDHLGIVDTINKAGAELFGYSQEEIVGHNIHMLMPEPERSQHDGYLEKYMKTKKASIIGIGREVNGKRKDGTLFPFQLAVSEVVLHNKVLFAGIVHDLSQVKKAEEQLITINEQLEDRIEERTNELEKTVNKLLETNLALKGKERELKLSLEKEKELNELKSRFVSMASHEFRTPLSTILSSASLISRYTENEDQTKRDKHTNRIKSAVANLTGILNDFLSLSKLEEGAQEVNIQELEMEEVCKEVTEEVAGMLKATQNIKHLTTGQPYKVSTDKHILKNVLFNVVSNAIKYSPERADIDCSIEYHADYVEFKIKDYGIGIPSSEQKHIFTRFFRASNAETIQGTGLGLNIVRRYIEMLSGEIDFSSEESKGTTFFIKIPKKI